MLAAVLVAVAFGCSGGTSNTTHTDAAPTTVDGEGATDGRVVCPGPITNDRGISSLFYLPLAIVCGSTYGYQNRGTESKPCEGTIMVSIQDGADTSLWWLFDAKTGDLDAVGGGSPLGPGCDGARPGFVYPYQCANNVGWTLDAAAPLDGEWTELCTDASTVHATDAGDACAPSSCPECPSGSPSYFSVVDGCVAWQCCL